MRTVSRLRLLLFSFYVFSDKLSTSVLVALSKPSHPHQKYIATVSMFATDNSVRQYTSGGGGENRTPVQNTFLVASHNHSSIIHYLFLLVKYQLIQHLQIVSETHMSCQ